MSNDQPYIDPSGSNSQSDTGFKNHSHTPSSFSWLKKYDLYATPITLNFNKKGKFATIPGAICTFVSAMIIIFFLCLRIIQFDEVYYTSKT